MNGSLSMLALLAVVAHPVSVKSQVTAEEKAVMQVVDRANQAYRQRDTKAYEQVLTADFIRVTPNGRVHGRSEWLQTVTAPGAERPAPQHDQLSVRVYGNSALVTYHSLPAPGSFLTRVLVKEGAEWKLALAQSTNVQSPAASTSPSAASTGPAWSPTTPAEQEALATFEALREAGRNRDVPKWEALSAPDFMAIDDDGSIMTRADRVAMLKAPSTAAAGSPSAETELRIVVKGDLAIVTSRRGNSRSLKVLARKGGSLQQILQQFSPIVSAQ